MRSSLRPFGSVWEDSIRGRKWMLSLRRSTLPSGNSVALVPLRNPENASVARLAYRNCRIRGITHRTEGRQLQFTCLVREIESGVCSIPSGLDCWSEDDIRTKVVYTWLADNGFSPSEIHVEYTFEVRILRRSSSSPMDARRISLIRSRWSR